MQFLAIGKSHGFSALLQNDNPIEDQRLKVN